MLLHGRIAASWVHGEPSSALLGFGDAVVRSLRYAFWVMLSVCLFETEATERMADFLGDVLCFILRLFR